LGVLALKALLYFTTFSPVTTAVPKSSSVFPMMQLSICGLSDALQLSSFLAFLYSPEIQSMT